MAESTVSANDLVRHARYGIGTVRMVDGPTAIVRFSEGLQECELAALAPVRTPLQALLQPTWDDPLEVIARVQAEAIRSVNDAWGVFSRSRIELLPHQLWVCRRVLERWPFRWLVADDVGLGKTIEAGLILWPLLSRGQVRRLLILCPASLVEQWQWRLKDMFDIRLQRYTSEQDDARSDYWGSATAVVASLETLRIDHQGRQERLLASDPWDLLIVDEAHRLNADEFAGPTLGYRLVEQLVTREKVRSMAFFTGTPHRGKDYGFWSLLRLLRPDLFDPQQPAAVQLPALAEAMIRNNKQNVTDLAGRRLFRPPLVESATYAYAPAEAHFYAMLTDFILRGEAYASGLASSRDQRAVILVLIAMQKLASSSIAAVRRALKKRHAGILRAIERTGASTKPGNGLATVLSAWDDAQGSGDLDATSRLEEELAEAWSGLHLMADEEPRLRELIAAAEAIRDETKIAEIIRLLRTRFAGRSVLFFTEYKATQSLLMSALIREFGDGCVTFINGDERAEEVLDARGVARTLSERRERAAARFNAGEVRFLVSTEAGGEGIDLQQRCHSLIHVDLPWNPMRMHQRVGRLNRYGQTEQVEVISLHNPDTVESLIWEKLNTKLESIMRAFGEVMDEPEDLLQLVLGMTSPSLFTNLFADAYRVPRASLDSWFDGQTARFGGQDVVDAVKELVGHATRFDYGQVSERIPRTDLPALRHFLRLMLTLNGRQIREDEHGMAFKTPDGWLTDMAVRQSYEGLIFERGGRARDATDRVVGVGHRVFDQALRQALALGAAVATVPDAALAHPLVVITLRDRVTTEVTVNRTVVAGVECPPEGSPRVLRDWELLDGLNAIAESRGHRRLREAEAPPPGDATIPVVERAVAAVTDTLATLDHPFHYPVVSPLAVLWPDARGG